MSANRFLYIAAMAVTVGAGTFTSCQSKQDSDADEAASLLADARTALAEKRYDDARSAIMHLRQDYPTAIDVRREAILTLDSVELLEAKRDIAQYAPELNEARTLLAQLEDNPRGHADSAYIAQRITVHKMEEHLDELTAKAKFFVRKIDVDRMEL